MANDIKFSVEPDQPSVQITASFDASREDIFRCLTDHELIPRWWGPSAYRTSVDKLDARPGGQWRFIQEGEEGQMFAFHGTYKEIDPPDRISYTFEFEGAPGHGLVETIELSDDNGQTKLTDTSVFSLMEDRDGMVAAGMESGAVESMRRLGDLLASF